MLLPYVLYILHVACVYGSHRVAVIGGGISGSTVAYRLRQLLKEDLELDLYEANEIGGRMVEVEFANATYEVGASLFHANNLYMKKLLTTLELKRRTIPIEGDIEVWYKRGPVQYPNTKDILNYYGYMSVRASKVIGEVLEDEMKIYSCQAQGAAYRNLNALIKAMGKAAQKASRMSLLDLFRGNHVSPAFIYELGGLMTRVAYGQTVDIHGLAGVISMVGMGSNPWAVIGGASQICREMIRRSRATVHRRKVRALTNVGPKKILVTTDVSEKEYDVVILAAPYSSDLDLKGFQNSPLTPLKYKKLVVTMVHGERCGEMGIVLVQKEDSNILSINAAHSIDGSNEDGQPVWRIHSKEPLSNQELSELFVTWINKTEKVWDMAYPQYLSALPDGDFQLASNLYYTNVGEMITSTAEFSVVSAYNVATLVHADLIASPLKDCK